MFRYNIRLTTGPPGSPNITAPIGKTLQTTHMVLKWNKPADNGGDASLRYRVVITEVSGSKAEAKAVSFSGLTDTQHTVTELLPGVRYKLQVFAVNKAGEGQAAEEHYFVAVDAQGKRSKLKSFSYAEERIRKSTMATFILQKHVIKLFYRHLLV